MYNSVGPVVFLGESGVTTTRSSKDPEVGQRKTFDNNEYLFVYNDCNSQINPGYAVIPQSGMSTASVTLTSVTNSGKVMGIVKNSTLPTASYGWVITRGTVAVEMNGTSGTVAVNGDIGIGALGVCTPVTIATGIFSPAFGQALAAIVSGASGQAYVGIY